MNEDYGTTHEEEQDSVILSHRHGTVHVRVQDREATFCCATTSQAKKAIRVLSAIFQNAGIPSEFKKESV